MRSSVSRRKIKDVKPFISVPGFASQGFLHGLALYKGKTFDPRGENSYLVAQHLS